VSQDRHEVYLTFATFDKDYVEYVSRNLDAEVGPSEESNSGPFLRMNEFGPFDTTNKSHMKCLGYYVLALQIFFRLTVSEIYGTPIIGTEARYPFYLIFA
jgi:hypothetical protein